MQWNHLWVETRYHLIFYVLHEPSTFEILPLLFLQSRPAVNMEHKCNTLRSTRCLSSPMSPNRLTPSGWSGVPTALTCASRSLTKFRGSQGFLHNPDTGLCSPLLWLEGPSFPRSASGPGSWGRHVSGRWVVWGGSLPGWCEKSKERTQRICFMVYLKSLDLLQQQNVKLNAFLNFFSIMGEKEFKEHHALKIPKSWISACSGEMIILFH